MSRAIRSYIKSHLQRLIRVVLLVEQVLPGLAELEVVDQVESERGGKSPLWPVFAKNYFCVV
jgi:hypothetical protein